MFTKILHRPALAIVISIIILFLGGLGIKTLPISQFPSVAPPTVVVSIAYPGASANVLVDSVLVLLEQAINGVQNMRYMASAATSAGEATILIYLRAGHGPEHRGRERAKPDQHREEPAPAPGGAGGDHRHPGHDEHADVREHLQHGSEGVDQKFLYNFANVNILPEIKRVRGIGSARILGNRTFAMRVWLNLDRMRAYKMSAEDVMKAVAEQSMIGSPGRLGQATGKTSQSIEYVLTWVGTLQQAGAV